jgi:S-adenosylmethionine hydrolase
MIVAVDTFGNLLTNVPKDAVVGAPVTIRVGSARFDRVVQTYSDVDPGELLVYIGSGGFVEIGQREGGRTKLWGLWETSR